MYQPARPRLIDAERSAPRWRLIYFIAYAILLPLVLMALALWWPGLAGHDALVSAVCSYAALFATFMAGFHWGIGLRYMATTAQVPSFHFIWGPVPAVLAWVTLLLPPAIGLLALTAIIALAYGVDHYSWPGAGLGPWLNLRRQVTIGLMLCCLLAAAAIALA